MKIGIVGLGYVGLTTAACLLRRGYRVVGFEASAEKRALLRAGCCPLSEPGVGEEVKSGISKGSLQVPEALADESDVDLLVVCVGTPSDDRGGADLRAVSGVLEEVQRLYQSGRFRDTELVIRSSLPPGSLSRFSLRFPRLFSALPVMFYPEFLREGTAILDFENPPQTVLGVVEGSPAPEKTPRLLRALGLEPEVIDSISAEALKFACNAFHALKVVFGNEIGRLVASLGGNAVQVMELFARDTALNISPKYLRPGAPYGGSCLPKDTRSLVNLGNSLGLGLNLIRSCSESNRAHFDFIMDEIAKSEVSRIGILGLAFKKDTDDLRESPSLELLYRLSSIGRYQVWGHDFLVAEQSAIGVNRDLLNRLISFPEIKFEKDLDRVVANVDAVVVMHNDPRYGRGRLSNADIVYIDVAGWTGVCGGDRAFHRHRATGSSAERVADANGSLSVANR